MRKFLLMFLLAFTLRDGTPIFIARDSITAIGRASKLYEPAKTWMAVGGRDFFVQESVDEVLERYRSNPK